MAMEDHHHHQHHHYGMAVADLRQFMNTRPHFPPIPPHHHSPDHGLYPPAPPHRTHHPQPQPYDLMMVGRQVTHDIISGAGAPLHDFVVTTDHSAPPPTSAAAAATNSCLLPPSSNATAALSAFDSDPACLGGGGGDASTGRWPRQETLTLLEIRSRLDSKFKEANQKGPLWDEVSRIMSEEHGYQRSGKKCREKFENLYKYYKKTKEGKAGRQDGKHYRFFRQLEALYGDANNNGVSLPADNHLAAGSSLTFHAPTNLNLPTQHNAEIFQTPKLCDSLSLSNSSDFDTSSSEDEDHHQNNTGLAENGASTDKKNKRGRRSWKVKIKDFIDSQMRKLMEKQEAWLDKMLKALEHKEQERVLREEEWRKQEAARLDREHKFWAAQRAWIEARDAALMDTLQKLTGRELKVPSLAEDLLMPAQLRERQNENGSEPLSVKEDGGWPECEISRLMQLRSSMESRFQQGGSPEEVLWEDIAGKMACLGYDRSALMCKDKWNSISDYLLKNNKECCNKKRKENSRSCGYFLSNEALYSQGGGAYCEISESGPEMARLQPNEGSPPSNSNAGSAVPPDSCFRFLMADGNLWENYALKLNKGDNQ